MGLTQADKEWMRDTFVAKGDVAKPKAKARAKVARDTRTMAERRAAAVGGECAEHEKRFATAAGYAYHMEHTDHAE